MRRLLREPLVHFLALGAVLFVLGRGTGSEASPLGNRIVVTPGHVDQLVSSFAATWQRLPTEAELDGLISDRVREEVYYREALALGLDRDDIIIRRRLRQKVEFMTQDVADAVEPTEDELEAWLAGNADTYRLDAETAFEQIYFNPDASPDGARARAEAALSALAGSSGRGDPIDAAAIGDRSLLPHRVERARTGEIGRVFGERFAERLADAEPGRWSGPIESGYGLHLVFVTERIEARMPTVDEVRGALVRDWGAERRRQINDELYARLLDRYTVVIERPEAGGG